MTTVGFGDITPASWQAKLAITALLPLSTAALANAVRQADKLSTRSKIRHAKMHLQASSLLIAA